jgi:phosphoglycerate dehydrogenase-like enzyme
MEVIVYDPYVHAEDADQVGTLSELLGRSDFVSLHARATPTNAHLIGAAAIATMRPGAFLINTARPSLIDEAALDVALAEERLAGAALDVCEPTSPGVPSRLSRHTNVVITPHIGGATRETLQRGAEMLAEEIRRFAASEPLINLVGKVGAGA